MSVESLWRRVEKEVESIIQSVASDVVTNVLTNLVMQVGRRAKDAVITKWAEKKASHVLIKSRTDAANDEPLWANPTIQVFLAGYLRTPDAFELIGHIFAAALVAQMGDGETSEVSQILQQELDASLTLYASFTEMHSDVDISQLARTLFVELYEVCAGATQAGQGGMFAIRKLGSSFPHRLLTDKVLASKKNLTFLMGSKNLNVPAIIEFEEKYRSQVSRRHGYITPPSFDGSQRRAIDDLYVLPSLWGPIERQRRGTPWELDEDIDLSRFLSMLSRAVILGTPGGGKTTLANKLCHDIAVGEFQHRRVTPILVVLRDFAIEKKSRACSILQFVELRATSHYQTPVPDGAFEYMLMNGRALVIFDGLDELLDTSHRQEISADIELFCSQYPSVQVLVTSRQVGYDQAPLDRQVFEAFTLAPFDEGRVAEYAKKWFTVNLDLPKKECQAVADTFMSESRIVSDLRANPLLLALLCNIYKGENYLPANRAEIYEKCATMLFDRWDKSRDIRVTLRFQAHLNPIVQHIAHWIYADPQLGAGVTERQLVKVILQYLTPRYLKLHDEAEAVAREFLEFFHGRAWILAETGTTRRGERLYQFIHRTFLEYFTACYLVRARSQADALLEVLGPRIQWQEWDVVAQLAFQMLDRRVDGAADELLLDLLSRSRELPERESWNMVHFAARCLQYMIPSRETVKRVVRAGLDRALGLEWYTSEGAGVEMLDMYALEFIPLDERVYVDEEGQVTLPKLSGSIACYELVSALLYAAPENKGAIASESIAILSKQAKSSDLKKAAVTLNVSLQLRTLDTDHGSDELTLAWKQYADEIFAMFPGILRQLFPTDLQIAYEGLLRGKVTISQFVAWHGIAAALSFVSNSLRNPDPPALWFLRIGLDPQMANDDGKWSLWLDDVAALGHKTLKLPPPWGNYGSFNYGSFQVSSLARLLQAMDVTWKARCADSVISGDALFGVLVLLAWLIDSSLAFGSESDRASIVRTISHIRLNVLPGVQQTLLARAEHGHLADAILANLKSSQFTDEELAFVRQWLNSEIRLVVDEVPF